MPPDKSTRYRIAMKYSKGWRWAYCWNGDMTLTWRTESEAITAIHNGFPIDPEYRIVPSNAAGEFVLPSDEPVAGPEQMMPMRDHVFTDGPKYPGICLHCGDFEGASPHPVNEPQADTPECLASGEDLIDYENEMRDMAAQRVQIGWRMVAPSGVADPPGIALDQPEPVYRETPPASAVDLDVMEKQLSQPMGLRRDEIREIIAELRTLRSSASVSWPAGAIATINAGIAENERLQAENERLLEREEKWKRLCDVLHLGYPGHKKEIESLRKELN